MADWVCEILSPSTAEIDRTAKKRLYAASQVSFYWIAEGAEIVAGGASDRSRWRAARSTRRA